MIKKILLFLAVFSPLSAFAVTGQLIPFLSWTNSTGTQATTTSLFSTKGTATTFCFTGDTCRTTWPSSGGGAFPFDAQSWGVSTTTLIGLFNGFISNASSTINANLLINGNSTTTNATSTNFFATTASTTNLFGTNLSGFGLSSCNGTNALGWSGGIFSCVSIPQGTVTSVTGTANRITSSGGATPAIDISASYVGQASITTLGTISTGAVPASIITNGTFGTGDYTFPANLIVTTKTTSINFLATGSSTLQNFTGLNSTTTNATTTNIISTNASTTNLWVGSAGGGTAGCATFSAQGLISNTGTACGSGGGGTDPFTHPSAGVSATTSNMLFQSASSTFVGNVNITGNSTSTNATTTGSLSVGANLVTTLLEKAGNFLVTGSSTLQNFTGINATTSQATTTSFYVSGTASTSQFFANSATIGSLTDGSVSSGSITDTGLSGTNCVGESSGLLTAGSNCVSSVASAGATLTVSPSTGAVDVSLNLGHANVWTGAQQFNASTTLQNFTGLNSTTTNATTTTLTVTGNVQLSSTSGFVGIATTTPYGNPSGSLSIGAPAGAGCLLCIGSTTSNGGSGFVASIAAQPYSAISAGTSTPDAEFAFTASTTAAGLWPNILDIASSTSGNAFTSVFRITQGGISIFANALVTASSTLQNFTGINATTTNATSSSFAISNIASGNCLQTSTGGAIISTGAACATPSVSQINIVSTTTAQNISTSTLEGVPLGKQLHFVLEIASSSDNNLTKMWFNDKTGGWRDTYVWSNEQDAAGFSNGLNSYIQIDGAAGLCIKGCQMFIDLNTTNATSTPKMGTGTFFMASSTSSGSSSSVGNHGMFSFYYASSTTAIHSISIGHVGNLPLSGAGANYIGINSTTTVYAENP